jgi:hypothetical protein
MSLWRVGQTHGRDGCSIPAFFHSSRFATDGASAPLCSHHSCQVARLMTKRVIGVSMSSLPRRSSITRRIWPPTRTPSPGCGSIRGSRVIMCHFTSTFPCFDLVTKKRSPLTYSACSASVSQTWRAGCLQSIVPHIKRRSCCGRCLCG